MEDLAWMAWTPATGRLLRGAGPAARRHDLACPCARPRSSAWAFCGIPTTRGDRLFLSLVLAAVIHLAWIGFVGARRSRSLPLGEGIEVSSLWLASAISLVAAVVVFRTV